MKKSSLIFATILIFLSLWLSYFLACDTNPYKQGKVLYEKTCQNCHQEDGKAVATLIPPLAGSEYIGQPDLVACIIRYGLNGKITVNGVEYNHEMPPNELLTPIQIANIMNYVGNSWGNNAEYVSSKQVAEALENCVVIDAKLKIEN